MIGFGLTTSSRFSGYKLVRRSVFVPYPLGNGETLVGRRFFNDANGNLGVIASETFRVSVYNPYLNTWLFKGVWNSASVDCQEAETYIVDDDNNLCKFAPTEILKFSLTTGTIQPSVPLVNNPVPYTYSVSTRISGNRAFRMYLANAAGTRTRLSQTVNLATGEIVEKAVMAPWGTTSFSYKGTCCTLPDGRVWVGGGINSSNAVHTTNAYWSDVTNVWTVLPVLPQRSYAAAATSQRNGDIILAGGFNTLNTPISWVMRFDSVDNTWTQTDIVLPATGVTPNIVTTPTDQVMMTIPSLANPITIDPASQLLSSFWDQ